MSYSTQRITTDLINEVKRALHKVSFGSIEIIVQDNVVTQITVRNIKKTSYKISSTELENTTQNGNDKKKTVNKKNEFNRISTILKKGIDN